MDKTQIQQHIENTHTHSKLTSQSIKTYAAEMYQKESGGKKGKKNQKKKINLKNTNETLKTFI